MGGLKYLKCSGEVAGAVIAPSCSYLGERYQGGAEIGIGTPTNASPTRSSRVESCEF